MCTPKVLLVQALAALQLMLCVHGWGSSNSGSDNSIYAESFKRDWLYDATAISMKLEGCVWGYVADEEEAGCLASSSQDGTYYWYQMANCRRAQAAFSLYTTESSTSVGCNSNTYRETVSSTLITFRFFYPVLTLSLFWIRSLSPRLALQSLLNIWRHMTPTLHLRVIVEETMGGVLTSFQCVKSLIKDILALVVLQTEPFPSRSSLTHIALLVLAHTTV